MKIPEYYYTDPDFWRRLVQMADKLVEQVRFPKRRYDDDIDTLIEDVIQEMFLRILRKQEPEKPISKWPGFFYRVLYYVILERRDRAFEAHEAGREKSSGTVMVDDEETIPLEEQVVYPADPVDLAMQYAELPEVDEAGICVVDPRFWRLIDEELPGIADEKCRECFRKFAHLVWKEGLSRRAAWRQVKPTCHGDRWATFCRWLEKLGLAVMRRWAQGENQAGGGL